MAAGKAVVASPLAVEGLAVADGRELLVASSDGQFADAIVRILGDTGLQLRLASAAREWALENAGPDRTAAAFESLYRRLTGDRS
jgi:glycosyltransferase involved in cell wall biosynthesis